MVFPASLIDRLLAGGASHLAERYDSVSVLFADIAGFTEWCGRDSTSPERSIDALGGLFSILDDLAEEHGVYKVETIGDCYVAICGAPVPRADHAVTMARFALDVLAVNVLMDSIFGADSGLQLRIGVHCGPLVGGVIRSVRPRWQIFGDTVNMASRMESTGAAKCVQISSDFAEALQLDASAFELVRRNGVNVKGKGCLTTYWLRSERVVVEGGSVGRRRGRRQSLAALSIQHSLSASDLAGYESMQALARLSTDAALPKTLGELPSPSPASNVSSFASSMLAVMSPKDDEASDEASSEEAEHPSRRSSNTTDSSPAVSTPEMAADLASPGEWPTPTASDSTTESNARRASLPALASSCHGAINDGSDGKRSVSRALPASRSVLLVHPELSVALQMARILLRERYDVQVAASLNEARTLAARHEHTVVLCDALLAAALREEGPLLWRGATLVLYRREDNSEYESSIASLVSTVGLTPRVLSNLSSRYDIVTTVAQAERRAAMMRMSADMATLR